MGTTGTNICETYPYTLSAYASYSAPRTIITLDMLGGDANFQTIFAGSYSALLQSCKSKIDEVLARAQLCLGSVLPSATNLSNGIDNLCNSLNASTTLRSLMESSQASWPTGVLEYAQDLYDAGFYVHFQMIPDSSKAAVVNYFSDDGDAFLTKAGNLSLRNYFEQPRSAYSQVELDLLYTGRRLGVLLCHEAAALSDKPGHCWNGANCVTTSQNKACNGNSGSSDPC